jgi:hypothetical protein
VGIATCAGCRASIRDGAAVCDRCGESTATARPTVRPPFDPEQFARESDSRLRAVAASSNWPTVRPPSSDLLVAAEAAPDIQQGDVAEDAGSALGLDSVPLMAASPEELGWIDLPAEASALVAHVNGVATLGEICAKAGVTPEDGAFLMLDLAERDVVRFR